MLGIVAWAAACGPDPGPQFVGHYVATVSHSGCRMEEFEAPSIGARVYHGSLEVLIDETMDGQLQLALPYPRCPVLGTTNDGRLLLFSAGCLDPVSGNEFSDIRTVARWDDDGLQLETSYQQYFSPEFGGLPDWFYDAWSCSSRTSLEFIE